MYHHLSFAVLLAKQLLLRAYARFCIRHWLNISMVTNGLAFVPERLTVAWGRNWFSVERRGEKLGVLEQGVTTLEIVFVTHRVSEEVSPAGISIVEAV